MNSSWFRVQGEPKSASKQQSPTPEASILNLLTLASEDINQVSDLSQVYEIREFQLGDDLTSYSLSEKTEDSRNGLYVVCLGRVRLLSFDATLKRDVSTQLLETEQTFGADHLFCDQPLAYRVIAASVGKVIQIPISDLNLWLEQNTNLKDYLQQITSQRQALIFFKTCTELRSLSSQTLRQLLPYFVEKTISAGSSLVEATSPSQGRFWLAGGKIQSLSAQTLPPIIGGSWGYPELILPAWSAQTDLSVYCLPLESWKSAKVLAPQLFSEINDTPITYINTDNPQQQNNLQIPQTTTFEENLTDLPSQDPQPENPIAAQTTPDIDFPQPTHKRRSTAKLWHRYPFIEQQSSSDCGAACLAMISQYWGKRFSLNTLRTKARIDSMGASLKGLAEAAETLGYHALPVRASLDKVELRTNPWIAHWQGIHYVVVWRIKGDRVLISDPAIGKRSLSRQEFEASWTGYALLLNPTERLDATSSEKISLSHFWQAFWYYRNLLGQIIIASVLLQVFGLATPLITQLFLDNVVVRKNFFTLNVFAFGLLIFGLWRIVLTAVRQYLLDYVSNRMDLTLISGFISHTLRLPLQFFASRSVGDIITRVQENQKIQLFLTRQAVSIVLDSLMAFVYVGLMAYYNLTLTLLALALIPPVVILTLATSPFLRKASREIFQASAAQNSSMVEMMTGVATIKAAASEREMRWRWEERFASMMNARFRGQKLANNLQLISSLINHIGSTAVLWYGAILVMSEQMSVGQFVAFNMLIGNVIHPVFALLGLRDEFQDVMVSVERLNDVFVAQPEQNPQRPLLILPPIQGEVHFENVTFRYNQDEEHNTLQNISFEVKAGQTVALVGKSGSGKSTLVNLLQGLYHLHRGRILIDGHDIAHVSPQSLRSQLGVVPQECFLFSGTILENITLFSDEYTLEQAIASAKLAEVHAFIQSLPLGYSTQVGEHGSMLSGGQRQRIAIARALLRNPQMLILDEATSSLDVESEQRFQQNLARFSRVGNSPAKEARTVFIIAHRFFTVRHADYILVLDKGNLVEEGTHEQLMENQSFYYHLAQQQLNL